MVSAHHMELIMWGDVGLMGFAPALLGLRGVFHEGKRMSDPDPWAGPDRRSGVDRRRNGGGMIDKTINYGHLLTAGTILVGLIVWGTNSANDAKQAREETIGLRGDISTWRAEAAASQKELGTKVDGIQAQLSQKFPVYDNDLKNLTASDARQDAAIEKQGDDQDSMDRRVWTLERFMEQVQSASKGTLSPPAPLPSGPSPRR